jgi:pilus assembly protein CpaB
MTRRILTIGAALVLAVLGAVGVLSYAHQADQRALSGMRAVSAYVATGQITAGTSAGAAVQQGLLVSQKFPASSVPTDAVSSLTPDLSSLVLTSDLASGQMLLRPILGAKVATASSLPIPAGMVAVTLQFCVQRAVANYVAPGSEVAIFNTFVQGPPASATGSCSGISASKTTRGLHTRLVLSKVLVLAVGERSDASASSLGTNVAADPASNSSSSSSSSPSSAPSTIYVTMAVRQVDAERLIELGENQTPYLALMTSSSGLTAAFPFHP